jgi:hypothetical protein
MKVVVVRATGKFAVLFAGTGKAGRYGVIGFIRRQGVGSEGSRLRPPR